MSRTHCSRRSRAGAALACALVVAAGGRRAAGQAEVDPGGEMPPLHVSLAEAIEVALVRNYALNRARIDVRVADQQVREAYAEIYPSLDGSANYTRQFDALNPFAGSTAGNTLFGGDAAGQFLLENEEREANGQEPLMYSEFLDLRRQAQEDAGLLFDPDENPFFIDNRFRAELTVTQLLYDGSAFSGLKAAGRLKEARRAALEEQARQVVQEVATRYYRALLTRAQVEIRRRSEDRARDEVEELRKRVERGTRPKFDLLSTQVRLANAEAVRLRTENDAADAVDLLKLTLGLPHDQPIVLSDELEAPEERFTPPTSTNEALAEALETRPDLRTSRLQVELNQIEKEVAFAGYLPVVEAFFTAAVVGQVPDNRQLVTQPDPLEPATEVENRGFFAPDFWGPDILGGVRVRWNFFNGFGTTSRVAQNELAVRRARQDLQELRTRVKIEVARSLRTLRSAWEQLRSQDRNVENAELNYRHATIRVDEGVAGTVVLRDANEQLDNSRLNYLQSLHDYRLAEVEYEVAVGHPPFVQLEDLDAEPPDDEEE